MHMKILRRNIYTMLNERFVFFLFVMNKICKPILAACKIGYVLSLNCTCAKPERLSSLIPGVPENVDQIE